MAYFLNSVFGYFVGTIALNDLGILSNILPTAPNYTWCMGTNYNPSPQSLGVSYIEKNSVVSQHNITAFTQGVSPVVKGEQSSDNVQGMYRQLNFKFLPNDLGSGDGKIIFALSLNDGFKYCLYTQITGTTRRFALFSCKANSESEAIQCYLTNDKICTPIHSFTAQSTYNIKIGFVTYTFNDNTYFAICRMTDANVGYYTFGSIGYTSIFSNFASDWFGSGTLEIIEKDDEYGFYSNSGGYGGGSFDTSSDAFGTPELPSVGVTTTGFINVYNPTLNQLQGFADDLFPDIDTPTFDDTGTLEAVANNVKAIAQTIQSFANCFINSNMIQYVIDCHIVPCVPNITSNSGIKVGFKNFEYNPAKVTSDYVTVDCGTLSIKEYYANFLDYVGTKAKLFLPFVGFVDLKNEWFQDGKLSVQYHYNVIDGSFMAFILATSSKSELTNTVVGSYGGNACVHIPITGTSYSSMISGVVQGASKVVSNMKNADVALSGIADVLQSRPSVEQSNGYNSNSAFMGVRIPYMIIERPVASFSKNYPSERGLPLNVAKQLSELSGFTVCKNLHTDNLSCTKEEKNIIASLFASGVIL